MKTRKFLISCSYILLSLFILIGMFSKYIGTERLITPLLLLRLLIVGLLIIYLASNRSYFKKIPIRNCILLLFICYALVISFITNAPIKGAIVDILMWPMFYLCFKDYTSRSELPEYLKKITLVTMVLIMGMSLLLISVHLKGALFDNGGGVVFFVYYCITYMPMVVYFIDNKKIIHIFFILSIIILGISTKRTGFITVICGYIIYLFSDNSVSYNLKKKFKENFKLFLLLCAAIYAFIQLNQKYEFDVIERITMIMSDNGSGRIAIWTYVLNAFRNSGLIGQLLGHGYEAVYYKLKPFGVDRLAHNSYLEFLYDYGIIGTTIFIVFLISMILLAIKGFKEKNKNTGAMVYTLIICVVMGFTSYLFEESTIFTPVAVFWGCFDGERKNKTIC